MDYTVDMICDESRQKLRVLSEKNDRNNARMLCVNDPTMVESIQVTNSKSTLQNTASFIKRVVLTHLNKMEWRRGRIDTSWR
jgi:hypothetical protein